MFGVVTVHYKIMLMLLNWSKSNYELWVMESGAGQEHHVLQPVLEQIKTRYQKLGLSDNLYQDKIIVTADTGYANESNMQYLNQNNINAYIPDNQFRSRDPKFIQQKDKYGKRKSNAKPSTNATIPAKDFHLNTAQKSCRCPAGKPMWLKNNRQDTYGNDKLYFEGRLSDCRECRECRECHIKHLCMKNPISADTRNGHGRQASFIIKKNKRTQHYTDWMKKRIDSDKGKQIYSHRMSVVEPVFANICSNKGLNRFSLRGKTKIQGQWQLYCLVHNIEKLKNYGDITH